MDQMLVNTSFMKALISSAISKILRSNGIDVDLTISKLEITHPENGKTKLVLSAEGTCTDEALTKMLS